MPILRLNAGPEGLVLHGSPAPALPTLRNAARGNGPIIILIHGFKYDPGTPRFCPHGRIFGHTRHPESAYHTQWPRALGFACGHADEGLAIAFGWRARGNLWRAQRSAWAAGVALAQAIHTIRIVAPRRPIHAITHSMGSEVMFEALHHLPAHAVQRIITITGASYASAVKTAMETPAGRTAELLNVTSRENDVFDAMFEKLIAADVPQDRAMGAGINLANAVTLQLDCPRTLGALTRFGGHIHMPKRRVCHWSGYTRPGALRFYARALRHSEDLQLQALQDALPDASAPRWSRIFAMPHMPSDLLGWQKTAS
ncbi:alpha/beta hydrolase [uncultured Tateyamaria sp.]|uniref:alpha/beta hydrolase n=1 Tax=uncultured Tateyamaria sp. TaxID=455651 RepID=UPI00260BDBFB|nr:alpha/beta hydrolase [uncultured Tateyamaria sp.]